MGRVPVNAAASSRGPPRRKPPKSPRRPEGAAANGQDFESPATRPHVSGGGHSSEASALFPTLPPAVRDGVRAVVSAAAGDAAALRTAATVLLLISHHAPATGVGTPGTAAANSDVFGESSRSASEALSGLPPAEAAEPAPDPSPFPPDGGGRGDGGGDASPAHAPGLPHSAEPATGWNAAVDQMLQSPTGGRDGGTAAGLMTAAGQPAGGSAEDRNAMLDATDRLRADRKKGSLITEVFIKYMEKCFTEMNTDGSGLMAQPELVQVFQRMFPTMNEKTATMTVTKIFRSIDGDGNGFIDLEELEMYMRGEGQDALGGLVTQSIAFLDRPVGWRRWIWALCEQPASECYELIWLRKTAMVLAMVVQVLIVISVLNMMAETLPQYQKPHGEMGTDITYYIESLCIVCFTVEFLARTSACSFGTPPTPPNVEGGMEILVPLQISQGEYWANALTWIDLIAIVPWWLAVWGLTGGGASQGLVAVRLLRMMRLVRVLRVLKLSRHSRGIQLMIVALSRARLALTWMGLILFMAMALFASLLFFAEAQYQATFDFEEQQWVRDKGSKLNDAGQPIAFQSIPNTLWWSIVTLTTVGYGDETPATPGGKAIASVAMLSGVLLIAYPVTIIGCAYQEAFADYERSQRVSESRRALHELVALHGMGGGSPMSNVRGQLKSNGTASAELGPAAGAADDPARQPPPPQLQHGRESEEQLVGARGGGVACAWEPGGPLAPPPRSTMAAPHRRGGGQPCAAASPSP